MNDEAVPCIIFDMFYQFIVTLYRNEKLPAPDQETTHQIGTGTCILCHTVYTVLDKIWQVFLDLPLPTARGEHQEYYQQARISKSPSTCR